jgi:GxxExxY protein
MRMAASNANRELVYPELSYAIIGAAFRVFNELGYGLGEKAYQDALAAELSREDIPFRREVYVPIRYQGKNIARYFADFVITEKILLELKVVRKLGYVHARQTLNYLRSSGIRLGILIYFTADGVKYRRVLNSRTI